MAEPGKMMKIGRRSTLVKAFILLVLAWISIGLVDISPIKAYLGPGLFQRIISKADLMGPALLVIFCAVGTCAFVPVTGFVGIATGPCSDLNWAFPACALRPCRGSDLLSYCPQGVKGACLSAYWRQAEEVRRSDKTQWLPSRAFPPAKEAQSFSVP